MSGSNFSSFTNYKQTVIDITGDLKKLKEYSERLKLVGNTAAIDRVIQKLAADTFDVAVVGEFKRGKSTLINALLEKAVLPTDVIPTTATLNKVTYSVTPFVEIEYHDGRKEKINIDYLNDYVTKLTPESEEKAKTVKVATVYYPVNYCKNGVTIIDTPGLNDDEAMTEVTLSVLPQIDAAIMVMMAGSPFSQFERDFLENKIIASDLGRVMFVVTGIDLYDEEDVEKVLKAIRTRITESILKKAESTYGKNSPEYESCFRKLGNIKIYGLSAKLALKAKKLGDSTMLQNSSFPQFESALESFLTEERGAIMLNVPVNRIKTSSIEIVKAIQIRENALSMEKSTFDAKYHEAMEEIEKIRQERQSEFAKINETTQRTYEKLMPEIKNYWSTIEQAAMQVVDTYPVTANDLKDSEYNRLNESLSKAVQSAISNTSQQLAERMQTIIGFELEKEADRIADFENKFYTSTEKIQNLFVDVNKGQSGSSDTTISTALNYFTLGFGSAYMGYKEAGWKGALLGGVTGGIGTGVAGFGGGIIIGLLGLPFTWPVLIVAGIGAAIVGTFTGKWALSKAFSKNKIEKFRESFKDGVMQQLTKMKATDNIADSIRVHVEQTFEALKEKIRSETESILSDTQNQLTQLKVELAQTSLTSDKEKKELQVMLEGIDGICKRAEEISSQLTAILTR